jgi:GDP-4-dehydro-6-deoxy-D-mannose reductase
VTASFARQIAEIEKKKRPPVIHVGNLEAKRDFTDVRDIVRAYWLSLEKGVEGDVYNIGSGQAYSMQELLDLLMSLSRAKMEVKVDPARLRPSDVPVLLADASKFRDLTGWKPRIPFKQTILDLLNYWREKV